ncbi:TadE/TadG family type IV pilus assembly protein [Pseudemcibacter aquimaris]|uniref:TadE/TadG family type IV pilus assembly protein n=1 Tax=Pseudemcibacter aquimaris TaxID=2857064 RepID=UPI00201191B4|nr:TadE family protein [Pseudemcibacter aquimaris]MCC3859719.1 pilus assembly protein [Pseudemcibacter aquimaris]WDU60114.1 pilus assembly protein [Pseudemcibacter aquimaris]
MRIRPSNIMKALKGNEIGSVATEYALIVPFFLLLAFGMIETGRIMMVNSHLEGAITQATRITVTGTIPDGYEDMQSYIKAYLKNSLDAVGAGDDIIMTMKLYDSFANVGKPEPIIDDKNGNGTCDSGDKYTDVNGNKSWDSDMGADGTGGEENIMLMDVSINLKLLFADFVPAFVVDGRDYIPLSASTVVRNEPFGGTTWTPGTKVRPC